MLSSLNLPITGSSTLVANVPKNKNKPPIAGITKAVITVDIPIICPSNVPKKVITSALASMKPLNEGDTLSLNTSANKNVAVSKPIEACL